MFLYKVYNGNNQWFLYIFTLLIVFLAVQLGSIPLAIYLIIKDMVFSHTQETLSTVSNLSVYLNSENHLVVTIYNIYALFASFITII